MEEPELMETYRFIQNLQNNPQNMDRSFQIILNMIDNLFEKATNFQKLKRVSKSIEIFQLSFDFMEVVLSM